MSERTDYPSGAPCWVETLQPDPDAAAQFYGQLFGWQFDEPKPMPGRLGGEYLAARIAGRLVTGIGQAPASAPTALWSTFISVDSIEAVLTRVADAGGAVIVGPLQAGPDGRLAVVTDPAGVAFGLWQPAERIGAQLVNEPGTWAMSALHTPSPERARSFYSTVFGWQLQPVSGAPLAFWRLPGYVGSGQDQRMPDDVVAVMTRSTRQARSRRTGRSTSASTTSTRQPSTRPRSADSSSYHRQTLRASAAQSSPTRNSASSRSALRRAPERSHPRPVDLSPAPGHRPLRSGTPLDARVCLAGQPFVCGMAYGFRPSRFLGKETPSGPIGGERRPSAPP